jgi:hypothetical protein
VLPERVLDYESEAVKIDQTVLDFLPKDTSFGQRRYTATDKFWIDVNVVLMGSDRTSIHKPQYCLTGQGWRLESGYSTQSNVHIDQPYPYDLPVMKLIATKQVTDASGKPVTVRGIFAYWFVADQELTASHLQRVWWMARDTMRHGVLQRWAYVTYFAVCAPGQEEAAFERVKKLVAASVPKFQLTPQPADANATTVTARQ